MMYTTKEKNDPHASPDGINLSCHYEDLAEAVRLSKLVEVFHQLVVPRFLDGHLDDVRGRLPMLIHAGSHEQGDGILEVLVCHTSCNKTKQHASTEY